MGAETKIQWADHTWSPWVGCTKVSEGCRNCYAAERDHRWGGDHWGPGKDRKPTSAGYWRQALLWNKEAETKGKRETVFPSLCDPFDIEAPEGGLDWLWALIAATPCLTWLLLTKRPERAAALLPWMNCKTCGGTGTIDEDHGLGAVEQLGCQDCEGGRPWDNVWIIASVEDEAATSRIADLAKLRVAHRGLSCEPLLEHLDLSPWLMLPQTEDGRAAADWVIVGGESGARARPFDIIWARSIRDQCKSAGVPVFIKQLGDNPVEDSNPGAVDALDFGPPVPLGLEKPKGGDMAEWPEDLRVREFPEALR
jgi:protein gp37